MATIVGPVQVGLTLPGGSYAALNVTAAAVVKAAPGLLYRINVAAAGSAGSLTINDCATTGAATTANEIISIPFGSLPVTIPLAWPCASGIVVSAVPTGGQVTVSFT
jgi:hypothetical protein